MTIKYIAKRDLIHTKRITDAQTASAHRASDTATVRTHQQAVDICEGILFQDFGEEGRGRA